MHLLQLELTFQSKTVFIIDLPRRDEKELSKQQPAMTSFGEELIHFVQAMGLQQEVVQSLSKFDFSETAGLAFVHSMFVHRQASSSCAGTQRSDQWTPTQRRSTHWRRMETHRLLRPWASSSDVRAAM